MKNKLKNKTLLLIPILFLLTGCGQGLALEYPKKIDVLGLNWLFFNITDKSFAKKLGDINLAFASVVSLAYNKAGKFAEESIHFLSLYADKIKILITVTQALALVMVLIHFAKAVIKQYSNMDHRGSIWKLLKNTFKAILANFLFPGICILCFLVASYGGVAVRDMITDGAASIEEKNTLRENLNIYTEMQNEHLSFSTLCAQGQVEAGVTDTFSSDTWYSMEELNGASTYDWIPQNSKIGDKSYKQKFINLCNTPIGKNSTLSAEEKKEVYQGRAGTFPLSLGEALMYDDNYSSVVFVGNLRGRANDFLSLGNVPVLNVIIALLYAIVCCLMTVSFSICIIKRVIDLIITIAMGWWYIGSSVSDDEGKSSIMDLFKKILSTCLSHFFLIFEFTLWVTAVLANPNLSCSATGLLMSYVWMQVLTGTPTVVEEMVSSTGTATDFGNKARSIMSGLRGQK